MITDLIKRVAPELVSALSGTALCVAMASNAWAIDLSRQVVVQVAQAQTGGSIVTLDAPRIADYWMSATRQAGGVVVFDGYAPDEATRSALGLTSGADITWLKLGSGAPARYQSGVEFGLSALDLMGEGRIALRANILTMVGTARSSEDYLALLAIIAGGAPQGLVLAQAEIRAPRAETYIWSASKDPSGTIVFSGYVPSVAEEGQLLAAAGQSATETMTYASGEPNNFVGSATLGLSLLQRLREGRVEFDGRGWILTGTPLSPSDEVVIEADFVSRNLAASGWSIALAEPLASPPATVAEASPVVAAAPAEPVSAAPADIPVDPNYAFAASRTEGGATMLSGQVPADEVLRKLGEIGGGDTAAVSIADGAPTNFLADAEAGLQALEQLAEGRLSLSQGRWTLTGIAPDAVTRDATLATLTASTTPANWTTVIDLPPEIAPVATAAAPSAGATADINACAAPVAEFSARNAILFKSGAAVIADESKAALDELAADLALCPDAVVHIEGHTDSDGDETLNLALSVARAEAVVSALVARNVTASRLYAVGYGEAKPVADNATAQGKQLNRRIVVTVQAEHY